MNEIIKNAVEEYQCPGCAEGSDISCYEPSDTGVGCGKHCPGTVIFPVVGKIYLGMPTGFNRLGPVEEMKLVILLHYEDFGYNRFNIPVWKHLNETGHTMVRGISPRINKPFLHVILEDCMDKVECLDITPYLNSMD